MNSQQSISEQFDCSRLIQCADDVETAFVSTSNQESIAFGHPDPPRLALVRLSKSTTQNSNSNAPSISPAPSSGPVILLFAYTQHCVVGQILFASDSHATDPMKLCSLGDESSIGFEYDSQRHDPMDDGLDVLEETISSMTVVALDEVHENEERKGPYRPPEPIDTTDNDDTESSLTSVCSPVMLKGVLLERSTSAALDIPRRLAIVLGTTASRVFSVELLIQEDPWTLECRAGRIGDEVRLLFEVLPLDTKAEADRMERKARQSSGVNRKVPFRPQGGVSSVIPVRLPVGDYRESIYVWISYHDGTLVKMHHACFFPSIWERGAKRGLSLDDLLGIESVFRCQVRLPPLDGEFTVVPLPKYHRTPLAPLSPYKAGTNDDEFDKTAVNDSEVPSPEPASDEDNQDDLREPVEALVYGSVQTADYFPTLSFYTSETLFENRNENGTVADDDSVTGSQETDVLKSVARAVVGGVIGTALGALRWGFGRSSGRKEPPVPPAPIPMDIDDTPDDDPPALSPFPLLWTKPTALYACNEVHDMPRQVEHCIVDPDGRYLAATDNLGRVLLVDLVSKQIIRLWKGFREASCFWLQTQEADEQATWLRKTVLHLVIHSRQRRVMEVWRVRKGVRVKSLQVSRDAVVVPGIPSPYSSQLASCYLLQSRVPGGVHENQMERIVVPVDNPPPRLGVSTRRKAAPKLESPRVGAQRLQHLQQLLSTSNVDYTEDDVYGALQEIKSLNDLATALDLLAVSPVLEERFHVAGADFHRKALAYCTQILDEAMKDISSGDVQANPHVQILTKKIDFHTRVTKAYDILHKFEIQAMEDVNFQQVGSVSSWAQEATGWVAAFEKVTGTTLDSEIDAGPGKNIAFSTFASSCSFPSKQANFVRSAKIYFSDSSRTRKDVVAHVFKPFLSDVFSFNVVYSIFEALGLRKDTDYMLKCFGEWFMTLSARDMMARGVTALDSPIARFLHEMSGEQLKDRARVKSPLDVLYAICEDSTDLVRAFALGTICRHAVEHSSSKKEKSSYGRVSSDSIVNEWAELLRKLRVCLLVSLRLHKARLVAPISINHINEGDIFSVYEWLARDELAMSHIQEEITTLEKACSRSSFSFDPSLPEGDAASKFKMLQRSCLSAAITEEERSEYLVDFHDDDRFGALLLFLRKHSNPSMLAAHRALLLAAEWSLNPVDLDVLRDAFMALENTNHSKNQSKLLLGVALDIWRTRICPVFRGRLFGFELVQEISGDVVAPLLEDRRWVARFGRLTRSFLNLLRIVSSSGRGDNDSAMKIVANTNTWPPVKEDFLLRRLVERASPIERTALDNHLVIVCALVISDNIATLNRCVPEMNDCFLANSLSRPVASTPDLLLERHKFLEEAVVAFALDIDDHAVDSLDLGEIETVAEIWEFDLKHIRTNFLLAMYEQGKDRYVDELLTRSVASIHIPNFVEDGVNVACRRLDAFLNGPRLSSAERREVMGLLDADLCLWIHQRADKAANTRPVQTNLEVPIKITHLFILRLLSLTAHASVDGPLRVKIHSLVVLSGILVKAISS